MKILRNKLVDEFEGIPLNGVRRKAFNEFNNGVYLKKIKINKVTNCFCGSTDFLALSSYDRFGLPFGTQICNSCGLVTQTIRIDESSMPYFYENIYWPLIAGKEGNYFTFEKEIHPNPFFLEEMNFNKNILKIFEVGCGAGNKIINLSKLLEKKGLIVKKYGVDYSENALKVAKSRGITGAKGGINSLSKFGKADIVILSHVFEHFTDLRTSMDEVRNLMHEESYLYIEVPGINDLENKREYQYSYQMYSVLAHTFNFSLRSLTNVLNIGGFELIKGDEYVRSLFKISEKHFSSSDFISAHSETIEALKRAKKKNIKFNSFRKNFLVSYLIKILKTLLARDT